MRDPTQANRCEYFQFRIQAAAGPDADLAIEDVRRQLLADDDGAAAEPKTSWDQLFSD